MKHGASRQPKRGSKQPGLNQKLREVSDETFQSTLKILEAINHPFGLSIAIKIRYGDYAGVLDTNVDPLHFNDPSDFADAYQSVKLLSKFPHMDTGIDRQQAALKSFWDAERACLETNRRLRKIREGTGVTPNPAVQAVISMAARKISHILGDVNLSEISRRFGWGPGANIGVRGLHTSAYNKFSGPLDVTRNCLVMGNACINSVPSWANAIACTGEFPSVPVSILPGALRMVTGNEIIFVPKNAKTDRVIAVEPSLNSYIQKGIGSYIRSRLREKSGIDLNDQSVNQTLAQHGSRTGELATIDLSMASDTIARELVRELLPEEWYTLLASSRCERGTIKLTSEEVFYQKFSSMGNAYTFELESLIFYALSQACVDQTKELAPVHSLKTVSVFGDDIIAPTFCVKLLLEVLDFCGFTVNKSKSYDSGPFRESCGKDFFLGTNVRPFFLREKVDSIEARYKLANAIRRYSHQRQGNLACDSRFLSVWRYLVARTPSSFRFFISDGYGDTGFIANLDESTPSRPRNGWEGWRARALVRIPYRVVYQEQSFGYTTMLFDARSGRRTVEYVWVNDASRQIRTTLYTDGDDTSSNGKYTPRDRTLPKIATLLVREWYNLGPWHM